MIFLLHSSMFMIRRGRTCTICLDCVITCFKTYNYQSTGILFDTKEDFYLLGFVEFAPGGEAAARLLKFICDIRQSDCADLMTAVTGKNCCLNASRTDIFLENEPQSSATKNLIHLAQMIRQGTLAMYDYGNEDENNIHYGQPAPPVYNTASIPNDLPLFLSYGGQDLLSDVNGVQTLLDTLKDHDAYKLVVQYKENYAHYDFIFGFNAKQVVYDPLVAFFRLH
ncbi:triacylglycerol lipase 2-like isoform X2 [Camellia sinensis]|uniref:triacylglycerol lipase 2-like isoform X2 n=1 Tax=Camellia sinensis TaxID=4442 RepID=UPI001035F2DE|nr:triacylglycerol lipase 2-like isoform X2 [Camellia sinensis]XP_028077840.1 triacylglycerol lipase 2-like isoform X2 [Camellia sinensis]